MGQAGLPAPFDLNLAVEKMNKPIVLFGLLTAFGIALAEDSRFIAGLEPDFRPAGAPLITRFEQTTTWKAEALRGIAPPASGINFLKDQGAWYTSFNHPNSTGRYDIRGLYLADMPGKKE